jgi:hypothetical protein
MNDNDDKKLFQLLREHLEMKIKVYKKEDDFKNKKNLQSKIEKKKRNSN